MLELILIAGVVGGALFFWNKHSEREARRDRVTVQGYPINVKRHSGYVNGKSFTYYDGFIQYQHPDTGLLGIVSRKWSFSDPSYRVFLVELDRNDPTWIRIH